MIAKLKHKINQIRLSYILTTLYIYIYTGLYPSESSEKFGASDDLSSIINLPLASIECFRSVLVAFLDTPNFVPSIFGHIIELRSGHSGLHELSVA